MNERIKELAKQATVHGNTEHHLDISSWYLEKFAELIVKECMNIVGDGTVDGEIYHDRIKHHFGVKE